MELTDSEVSGNRAVLRFGEQEYPQNNGDHGYHNGIPQPVIDVASGRDHREGDRGQKAAEPTIANMIGKR